MARLLVRDMGYHILSYEDSFLCKDSLSGFIEQMNFRGGKMAEVMTDIICAFLIYVTCMCGLAFAIDWILKIRG